MQYPIEIPHSIATSSLYTASTEKCYKNSGHPERILTNHSSRRFFKEHFPRARREYPVAIIRTPRSMQISLISLISFNNTRKRYFCLTGDRVIDGRADQREEGCRGEGAQWYFRTWSYYEHLKLSHDYHGYECRQCRSYLFSRHCNESYTCLCVGPNPNHGYTNFDNFLWSMLTTFQLITLDYWEDVYNKVGDPLGVQKISPVLFYSRDVNINMNIAKESRACLSVAWDFSPRDFRSSKTDINIFCFPDFWILTV